MCYHGGEKRAAEWPVMGMADAYEGTLYPSREVHGIEKSNIHSLILWATQARLRKHPNHRPPLVSRPQLALSLSLSLSPSAISPSLCFYSPALR